MPGLRSRVLDLSLAFVLPFSAGCNVLRGDEGDSTTASTEETTMAGDSTGGPIVSTTGDTDAASEAGTTESTTTSDGGTTLGETTAAESTTTGDSGPGASVSTCGFGQPCDQFIWECDPTGTYSSEDCAEVPFDDALVCALQRLAAGEQAQLRVWFGDGGVAGVGDYFGIDIALLGDGTAFAQSEFQTDSFQPEYDAPELCTLKPASWFEACLADEGGPEQHSACMNPYEWFEGDCVPTTACG